MRITLNHTESRVLLDNVLDYIPIASTASNLLDLYHKYVTFPKIDEVGATAINYRADPYYKHVDDKSLSRCFLLLIPVLGNFFIGIYDAIQFCTHHFNEQSTLEPAIGAEVCTAMTLHLTRGELSNKMPMIWDTYKQNTNKSSFFTRLDATVDGIPLIEDPEFFLFGISYIGETVLERASDSLKKNKEFMLKAIDKNYKTHIYLHPDLYLTEKEALQWSNIAYSAQKAQIGKKI